MTSIDQLRDETRQHPADPRVWCRLARALAASGQNEAAHEAVMQANALAPSSAADLVAIGHVFELLGDVPRATTAYRRAAKLEKTLIEAHASLASLLLHQNDPRAAALALRVAIHALPESPDLHSLLARASEQAGQLPEAVRHAQRAVQLGSRDVAAHGILARVYDRRGETEDCLRELRAIADLAPNDYAAHAALGLKLARAGSKPEAIRALERAAALAPAIHDAKLTIGSALREAGAITAAIDCLKEAVRIQPNSVEAHLQLGMAFDMVGMTLDAIGSLKTASRLAPTNARALHRLGLVLRRTGDLSSAMNALVRASAAAPEDLEIQDALSEVVSEKRLHSSGSIPAFPAGETSLGSFGGDLSLFALTEMLEFFANQRTTGAMRIVSKRGEGYIELHRGQVVRVRSPHMRSLSLILEETDAITATDMKRILQGTTDPTDDVAVAQRMMDTSSIDRQALRDALSRQAEDALLELVQWQDGQVAFTKSGEQALPDPDLAIDTRFLLLEVMRRLDERNLKG